MRSRIAIGIACAGCLVGLGAATAHADDQVPVVTAVTPSTIVPNGQPIRLTVTGQHLSGVVQAVLTPFVAQRSVVVLNDASVLLVLPATLPPGTYAVRLETPTTGSDPASAPTFTVAPPASDAIGSLPPPPRPVGVGTFAPNPSAVLPRPSTATTATVEPLRGPSTKMAKPASSASPIDPLVALLIGLGCGWIVWFLWGNGGRMRLARRQNVLAQVVARPAQRLGLARICVQCGGLHWRWTTSRDLWRGGQFCSSACLAVAEQEAAATGEAERLAQSRLREIVIYHELEARLFDALTAELAELSNIDGVLRAAEVSARIRFPGEERGREQADGGEGADPSETASALDEAATSACGGTNGHVSAAVLTDLLEDVPMGQPLPL